MSAFFVKSIMKCVIPIPFSSTGFKLGAYKRKESSSRSQKTRIYP